MNGGLENWNVFRKKNSPLFCRALNSALNDISINCVGWTVRLFGSLTRTLFLRFLWITHFLWRKRKKVHDRYSILLPTLRMCTNLHQIWTNNKDFFSFACTVPLTWFPKSHRLSILGMLQFNSGGSFFT